MKEYWDIRDENGNKTGRVHERGTPMQPGEYHLSVMVWLVNQKGEFLISRRAAAKNNAGQWEPTGGSAVAGEESLTAALREVKEELGITLDPENGQIFRIYNYPHGSGDGMAHIHTWIFREEVNLSAVVLQPEETCDVMWADKEKIRRLIAEGKFTAYDYLGELFDEIG